MLTLVSYALSATNAAGLQTYGNGNYYPMHSGGMMRSMMGPWMMGGGASGVNTGLFWLWNILAWLTWVLIVVALIVFIRWMWKKGNGK